jgi:DUF4097 and DUF4098 domain-containing protein YvlB
MKTLLLLGIFLVSTSAEAQTSVSAQRAQEKVDIRIPASEFNAETFFHMKNINGDLNAEGYDGDEIIITGTKIVTSKPRLIGDFNPDEIYLDRLDGDNSIFIFVRQPGLEVKIEGDKLPRYLMSEFSTINDGEVVVTGMSTGVKANNVNGSVFVNDAAGKVDANTVNGNIRVEFAEAPEHDSEFHTVNGTIEVYAPKNLSAVVTFRSLNGELYTDFNNIEYLPNRVNKSQDGTTRYSIEQTAPIQIGEGGPELRFRLLNGNAYIKQRKS